VIVLIVGLAAAPTLIWRSVSDPQKVPIPSTYSTSASGTKALYLMLSELQLPVTRFRLPLSRLHKHQGVLVTIDPHSVPYSDREFDKLKGWIEKGNRLIIFHGGPKSLVRKARQPGNSGEERDRPGNLWSHSLAERFGLFLRKTSGTSRETVPIESDRLYGVERVSLSERTRWREPLKDWKALVGDTRGPVIVSKQIGKGEVTAVCDSTMVSNRYIGAEDNGRLLLALTLENGPPPEILFDEYHHGHAVQESFWGFVASSGFAWLLFQGLIGAALFFYSRRARFAGRFRSLDRPKGRSSLEYVNSMANVLESCRAGSVALEAMLKRFLGQLSRSSGVPLRELENNRVPELTAAALQGLDLTQVIEDCKNEMRTGRDSDRILALARDVALARRRLEGNHRIPLPE